MIEYIANHIIYENPKPKVRSRHGYFPGVIQLPTGEIVAMFVLGEAFESADQTTYVSRSKDLGVTCEVAPKNWTGGIVKNRPQKKERSVCPKNDVSTVPS